MSKVHWIVILSCLLPLAAVHANEVCADLSQTQSVLVKGQKSSATSVRELQKRTDDFIALAKRASEPTFRMKQLITQYSRFDASQDSIAKELKSIPDKYSLYGGIERASIVAAFDWGKYKLAVVQYRYQGQVAEEVQAFFCTQGGCRISNILDRAELPEEIALRFVHRLKTTNWQGVQCPDKSVSYSLAPTFGPKGNGHALKVYLSFSEKLPALKPEEAIKPDAPLKASMGNFYRCIEQARTYNTDDLYADASYGAVKSFLSNCTLNMDLGSMVPVLRGSKLSYLPPISLINVLRDSALKPLAWVTENGVSYRVYGVKTDNQPITTLIVLPLVGQDNLKMDWRYFGHDFSYLFLTPGFKRLISLNS